MLRPVKPSGNIIRKDSCIKKRETGNRFSTNTIRSDCSPRYRRPSFRSPVHITRNHSNRFRSYLLQATKKHSFMMTCRDLSKPNGNKTVCFTEKNSHTEKTDWFYPKNFPITGESSALYYTNTAITLPWPISGSLFLTAKPKTYGRSINAMRQNKPNDTVPDTTSTGRNTTAWEDRYW